ncbi:hypothetical protein [uncultured Parasphingorhabdus sp.]|uniref:hypothetical protein n=1 Tax=uncultured Parasphingorhabdus sp. TaxID=2709694 RepID=UPI0030DA3F4C|tara:strand:+ start:84495 stop:85733 length:1239 start_codon:yes stop_codon:yes gene_type:complete
MTYRSCNDVRLELSVLLVAAAACSFPATVRAQANEPRLTIDLSFGGVADSNPFLLTNGDSSAAATVKIEPKVIWENESSSAIIDSSFRLSQYTNRYGRDEAARIGAQARTQVDERTSVSTRAGFQSSRSTLQDSFFLNPSDPFDPGFVPEVPLTDVTVAGRRVRVNTFDASAGINHVLSPSASISFSAVTSYSKFSDGVGSDYRTGFGNLQYSRRLSERTSVSASVSAGIADYIGSSIGDATIVSPQFGVEHQLSERVSLNASAGVSYASIDDGAGDRNGRTYISGQFSLCDRDVRSSICGSMSRSAEPTALGGISAVTSVAINYDLQLSLKDRFAVSGRYGRTDRSSDPLFSNTRGKSEIYGAQAVYTRYLSDRVSFDIMPSFTKIYEPLVDRDPNYSIMASIKIRFGKLR